MARSLALGLLAVLALCAGCSLGSDEPETVQVFPSILHLQVGETAAIDWSVRTAGGGYRSFDAADFIFATTDTSIATVDDDGYVTAHRTGNCQVVATLRDYHLSGSAEVRVN
jgi:uncharacterized protein YjdB